jgi:hypothetical protein
MSRLLAAPIRMDSHLIHLIQQILTPNAHKSAYTFPQARSI